MSTRKLVGLANTRISTDYAQKSLSPIHCCMRNQHCADSRCPTTILYSYKKNMPITEWPWESEPKNRSAVDSFSRWILMIINYDKLCCPVNFQCRMHATAMVTTFQSFHRSMGQRSCVKYICACWRCAQSRHLLCLGLLHRNQVCLQSGAADAALVASTRIPSALVV
jgi:hypothetical protein